MKKQTPTILITAYAVNPYKGSEDGMGWNFILQAAGRQQVIAITRRNNGPHIRRYMQEHPLQQHLFERIRFVYFDWPQWTLFWKKGPLLSLIYYYWWQLTLACWLLIKRPQFDIAHNLNFHNDWTPSFLWLLGKPFVWGPVGHHPAIPKDFLLPVFGRKAWLQDRLLWVIKCWFWYVDPFVYITKWRARHIFCMNEAAAQKLRLPAHKYSIMPSVATDEISFTKAPVRKGFKVLSIGRFVPLKGFDLTIKAFARFYKALPANLQADTKLVLVGAGPLKGTMEQWISQLGVTDAVEMIAWMPKEQLPLIYAESSVFLFPSHEGAGMVVAEAMSYGLPVLCLDNSGPGAFLHPRSALAVPYQQYDDTIAGLADGLTKLLTDLPAYETEADLAQQRFHSWFLWDVRGRQLHQVYRKITGGSQRLSIRPTQPVHVA
ncbi:MAG: glycosyltransferase [Chitinophagaceae bacterium]|jgi:glycosyltransferase involved in cell wall biosynthesis|nr:glycosyltransferase [Chitinophagaceae bacterium]